MAELLPIVVFILFLVLLVYVAIAKILGTFR